MSSSIQTFPPPNTFDGIDVYALPRLERGSAIIGSHPREEDDQMDESSDSRAAYPPSNTPKGPPLKSPAFQYTLSLSIPDLHSLDEVATLPFLNQLTTLTIDELDVPSNLSSSLITFPTLESLTIRSLEVDSSRLFERMATPNLRHLHIEQYAKLLDIYALRNFLDRTQCPLERLYMYLHDSGDLEVLRYINRAGPRLVHLRRLTLGAREIGKLVFGGFTPFKFYIPPGGVQTLIPTLEHLSFLNCCAEEEIIGEMMRARADVGHPLVTFERRVKHHGSNMTRKKDEDVLRKLKKRRAWAIT